MYPERIGPYLIDRKIGAGGMGNVFHGVHEKTGQEAAVKVLPASMAREDGFVQRFTREIDALRQLSNKHIVQLFQDGTTADETLYYSMEYVDGVTLTTEITDRKRLPWKEVIELSLQIATALKAAHDAGIIHRDLKPSNLMLTRDRVVKLTDFGVASLFASSRLTRTGGVVGTAEYMSPEQARGQRATRRSDLYSLGAVMYAMLTGRPPFTGPTANDILQKHQFSQFDKPSRFVGDIPRLLEELVCQLLEKDPAKRLPDALVVMRRLEQIRARLEYVEQNLESETMERPGPGTTVHAQPESDSPGEHSPGPATMVRNMIRDEASAALVKTPLARFFDNLFVLLTLFTLLIVFGLWMRSRSEKEPSEILQMALDTLAKPPGPAWIRARDELLQPLLDEKALPDQQSEIRDMIARVDEFDFCRSLKSSSAANGGTEGEIERLIRKAFEEFGRGDSVAAWKQLQAVQLLLKETRPQSYLLEFVTKTLEEWEQTPMHQPRRDFLEELRKTVETKLGQNASRESLQPLLDSAELLYRDDQSASEQLAEIRKLLTRDSGVTPQ